MSRAPQRAQANSKQGSQVVTTTQPARGKVQAPPSGFDPSKYARPGLNKEDILKIKECFDIFDDDKSGHITPNELKNAIMALEMQQSADEIVKLIEDLDNDGTNTVDFQEFLQIFGFTGSINDPDVLEDLFKQFDQDGTGQLSVDDFKRINDLVGERYTENELREMVEYADKDKDGRINWNEFQTVVLKEYANV